MNEYYDYINIYIIYPILGYGILKFCKKYIYNLLIVDMYDNDSNYYEPLINKADKSTNTYYNDSKYKSDDYYNNVLIGLCQIPT